MRADIHDGQGARNAPCNGPNTDARDQLSPDHYIRLAPHGRSIQKYMVGGTEREHRGHQLQSARAPGPVRPPPRLAASSVPSTNPPGEKNERGRNPAE